MRKKDPKKGAPSRQRRIGRKRSAAEWDALRDEFRLSQLTLRDFAKKHRIAYSTIRKHIKATDKAELPALGSDENAEKFRKAIEACKIEDGLKFYVRALQRSHLFIERMVLDMSEHWARQVKLGDAFDDANQIGRLALAATERLTQTALELQGLPADQSTYGWPLTRDFWPHPYQRSFIFDLPSTVSVGGKPARHFAFVGGIGSGKTRCGAEKFGDLVFRNRGCPSAIYAPTYRMLEDSTKRVFLELCARKGLAYKYRPSDNSMILFGDTPIMFRSMDDPEHLRGPEVAIAWIDEGAQMKSRKPNDVIAGRVRHPKATMKAVLHTTSPAGFNWFYAFCVEEGEKNRVVVYHARTADNVSLDNDYVETLSDMYDERFAKQELEGEFIEVFAGQAYWNFARGKNVTDAFDYNPNLPLILVFDLNVDPMCWGVGQSFSFDPLGNGHGYSIDAFFDELHIRTASTTETLKEFKRRYGKHKAGLKVYGDATWKHRRATVTTLTDYEVIKKGLGSMPGVELFRGRSNPAITDSVAAVNTRLKDRRGRRRLFVHPRCKYTIKDFEQTTFKPGTRELNKSNGELTHHTDAIRYYIAKMYPIRKLTVSVA